MDFPTPGMYLTPVPQEELLRLKNDCEIPHLPTKLTYHLRRAVSGGGDLADEWNDKPHRLIYDACREIERLNVCKQELEDLVEQLNWELVCYESDT
jgi:hypothetical protein